jgi:hypothetical protein
MKLIAEYDKTYSLIVNPKDIVINQIMKLPTFHLEPAPQGYKNSSKRKLVIDSYGNIVSLVSSNYVLSQPRDTLLRFAKLIADKVRKLQIYYYNGEIYAKFILDSIYGEGSLSYKAGFVYRDSVTRTFRLSFIFAPRISECGNELYCRDYALATRHIGKLHTNVQVFMENFEGWLADVDYIKRQKDRMSREVLTEERYNTLIRSIVLPAKVLDNLKYKPNMSLWDLYMQITHYLTIYNSGLQYHISASRLLMV